MRVHKRLLIMLVLIGMVVAVAGCGSDAGLKSPAAFDVLIDEPPVLPSVPISAEPIWGSDQVVIKHVGSLQFRGDTAIVTGSAKENSSEGYVVAVDAATGTTKWSLETLNDLPGGDGAVLWESSAYVAGPVENWVVLVNYYSSECTQPSGMCPPGSVESTSEWGIAALSPEDGSVLWKIAGVPSVDEDSDEADALDDLSSRLMAVSNDVALMVIAPNDALVGGKYTELKNIRVRALNPVNGTTLWETTGAWPRQIVGDVVLANVPPTGPGGQLINEQGSTVALELSTGEQRWSLESRYPHSDVVAASADVAVVQRIDKGAVVTAVIRLSDGSHVTDMPASANNCTTDGAKLIACTRSSGTAGYQIVTYQPGDGVRIAVNAIPESAITAAWNGYIFYGAYGVDPVYGAADYSGNVLSSALPGRVVAVTDKYAVFDTSKKANTDPGSFAVYGIAA